ncbi:hypothetical protein V1J52_13055 [Streptomyces sp. TRM 70351]|uniref:hypothetical protein n=1 Tax=Streptomyces sp. TRM 70351 TaxID=3116552 RepID=UPI002E7B5D42|nr:hypothetical protein [Streptomyces sp. TRM 70351]MEE1929096.1 hypothetical protein [Streptomyces sp. TRM 70351]
MLTVTVCAALTAVGLAASTALAWRRRFSAAARLAAVSLLPLGLALSGLLALAGRIGRAIGSWAGALVLDPQVWAGFGILASAVVLYAAGRLAASRTARRGGPAAADAGRGRPAPPPAAGRPAVSRGQAGKESGGEDFSEIEDILKKHGI